MKLKLFTHNDLDGIANVILAKQLIKYGIYDELKYEICTYENINEKIMEYLENPDDETDILITDISINEEVAETLDNTNINKYLFDHHITAKNLNKYSWCKVEIIRKDSISIDNPDGFKISATNMFFNAIVHPQLILKWNYNQALTITEFVFLVDEYDTWAWESNETIEAKRLNDLLYIKGIEKFIESITEKINNGEELFDEDDNTLLNRKQMLIDFYIHQKEKEMVEIEIENFKAGIVYAEDYISELASQILKRNKNLDIIAIINRNQISFRTRKDNINVAKLAKKYGGGGHFKASGCIFTDEMKKRAFNAIFNG